MIAEQLSITCKKKKIGKTFPSSNFYIYKQLQIWIIFISTESYSLCVYTHTHTKTGNNNASLMGDSPPKWSQLIDYSKIT